MNDTGVALQPSCPYYTLFFSTMFFEKSKISNKENLNVFDFLKLEYKTILRYTDNYEAK